MTQSKTQELAGFVSRLRYTDLPDEVVAKAKELALHAWGVQLAASTLPWCKQVYRYVRSQGGPAESTVVNYGIKTTLGNAAFINGTFSHAFESDDNHARTAVKAGCVTVPTALAVGERRLSSGKDFITALVAGYEVMIRVGFMLRSTIFIQGGHPTGATGAFGAAAVAGKLLGLDETRLTYALGGAGNQQSGLTEIPAGGRGHIKRTFGGAAAASGIRATLLAREGLTGPITTLDHGSGFARTFLASESSVERLTEGLGENWEILNLHYKIYGQDGYIQPMSQAFEQLREKHPFKVEDVESVWLGTNKLAYDEIIGPIRDPKDVTDAQFSANYSAALFLVAGGAGFDEYTDENLHDPVIRDLAERVTLEIDPEIEADHERIQPRGAKVAVKLKNGDEYRETVRNLREMTPADLDAKYRKLSRMVLEEARSERLLDVVHELERVRNVGIIGPMLVG